MKAFAVVALLLLCGCYAASFAPKHKFGREGKEFKPKKWMANRKARSESQTLELKMLPCSFEAKYTDTWYEDYDPKLREPVKVEREGIYKQYGLSQMDKSWQKGHEDSSSTIIFHELPDDPTYDGLFVESYVSNNQCFVYDFEYDSFGPVSWVSYLLTFSSLSCETMQETTWQGKKCTNCSYDGYYYYVKDGRLIGLEDSRDGETILIEYTFKDVRKDIVLSKDCTYEDPYIKRSEVPAEAYKAPDEIEGCGTKVQTLGLKELPCTYELKYKGTMFGNDVDVNWKKYGYSMLATSVSSNIKRDTQINQYLKRADIHEDGKPLSALEVGAVISNECQIIYYDYLDNYTEEDDGEDPVAYYLGLPELQCLMKKDTTWHDKKCTECVRNEGVTVKLYVQDGLIIGADVSEAGVLLDLEYRFEDFRKEVVLNKTCELGDPSPIPQAAYSEPEELSSCSHEPKSRSGASTISVAAAMMVCMVMVTLISLF